MHWELVAMTHIQLVTMVTVNNREISSSTPQFLAAVTCGRLLQGTGVQQGQQSMAGHVQVNLVRNDAVREQARIHHPREHPILDTNL